MPASAGTKPGALSLVEAGALGDKKKSPHLRARKSFTPRRSFDVFPARFTVEGELAADHLDDFSLEALCQLERDGLRGNVAAFEHRALNQLVRLERFARLNRDAIGHASFADDEQGLQRVRHAAQLADLLSG